MVLEQRFAFAQLLRLRDDVRGNLLELRVQSRDLVVQGGELALDVGDLLLDLAQDVRDLLVLGTDRSELCLGVGEGIAQLCGILTERSQLGTLRAELSLELRLLCLGVEDRVRRERGRTWLDTDDQPSDRYQCHQAGGQT